MIRALSKIVGLLVVSCLLVFLPACLSGEFGSGDGQFSISGNITTFSFSRVPVGSKQTKSFTLQNIGGASISHVKWVWKGNKDGAFRFVSERVLDGLVMEAGDLEGLPFQVEFSPEQQKDHSASLHISGMTRASKLVEIVLQFSYKTPAPEIQFRCAQPLSFGVVKAAQSKEQTCDIVNISNDEVEIVGATYVPSEGVKEAIVIPDEQFPFVLKPSQQSSVPLRVRFLSQQNTSLYTGQIVFSKREKAGDVVKMVESLSLRASSRYAEEKLVPKYPKCRSVNDCASSALFSCSVESLSGTKRCAPLVRRPTLFFPLQTPGQTLRRSFWIQSTGDVALTVKKIELLFSDGSFHLDRSQFTLPFTIEPKQQKEIFVEYTSKNLSLAQAYVDVETDSWQAPFSNVHLRVYPEGCRWAFKKTKLTFSTVERQLLKAVNIGQSPCRIKSLQLKQASSVFSLRGPSIVRTYAPGEAVTVEVLFAPRDLAQHDSILQLKSNDLETHEVSLSGKLQLQKGCVLKMTQAFEFPRKELGSVRSLSTEMINVGSSECKVSSMSLAPRNPPLTNPYRIQAPVNQSFTLTSLQRQTLTLEFAPQEAGSYDFDLIVHLDTAGSLAYSFGVRGSAGKPCVGVSFRGTRGLSFPRTQLYCTQKQTLSLHHTGEAGCPRIIRFLYPLYFEQSETVFSFTQSSQATNYLLEGGAEIPLVVTYRPTTSGVHEGKLMVHSGVATQEFLFRGEGSTEQFVSRLYTGAPKVDVLFVLKNSKSMAGVDKTLAKFITTFLQRAKQSGADYHIAVVSTHEKYCKNGRCGVVSARCIHHKVITPQTPDAEAELIKSVLVGSVEEDVSFDIRWYHELFSEWAPLEPFTTKCNQGFYRKDARLSVIHIGDVGEDFRYPNLYEDLKGESAQDLVIISAIGSSRLDDPKCKQSPHLCAYQTLAKKHGGYYASITNVDWTAALEAIAKLSFQPRHSFYVPSKPDAKTFVVKVDGNVVEKSSWHYASTIQSIYLKKNSVPSITSKIEFSYRPLCHP